ncbi:70 kDa peptidyl-prolyl isomerase-like [Schistocerca piceifrons]|uniref:70 kDa peptidyl-prolyl isomerase-like n=1 Tax=Schistocerca piceifrons TaxID=274613 RepID=UPI001F5F3238|nr:70 kDa peptidyl-prolyl isomerase-like [Schistocerca piceifrons]XP_047114498.1 70 kDa peptidyl-prolyl isomerase-like [Schistocerca piceifrons]
MESGDHIHTDRFVSSSAEHSKPQEHAELGMMENLRSSEELGFMGDRHIEHQPEDFLFGGGVRKDKFVPSATDVNQFILHESRTNVPTEEGLLAANTNVGKPSEASENEDLGVAERTHNSAFNVSGQDSSGSVDIGENGLNKTSSKIAPENGQTATEAEENRDGVNSFTFPPDKTSDSVPRDEVAKDSDNTNLQTNMDVLKVSPQINKTDAEDFKSNDNSLTLGENADLRSDDHWSSNSKTVQQRESLGPSEQKSENENVKESSENSNNSFISNERSEIQTKTESDEISESEKHLKFVSHEGDKKDPVERKQQIEFEDKHSALNKSEGESVEEKKQTESPAIAGNTHLGENQEDLKLDTSGKQEETDENTDKRSELPVSKDETEDEWLDILGSGHLKKKIIKKAENEYRPQNLHICEINLEGRLEDGTVVEKFENLKIQIGDVEVIQGIDLALPLMNVGEVALLEVGPRFAYGNLGRSPDIPPDAKLMYTIELLSAEGEPDLESLSIAQRREIGDKKRERGNWWFSRQEYSFAIQSYRRAIEFLDEAEGGFSIEKKDISEDAEKQLQELLEDRLKVFNNLAAAQMKIKAYDAALKSVDNVLRCQPQNVKALFRKGKILAAKGDTTAALSVLRNASQLEPESKVIKQEVQRLLDVIKRDTKQEKSLYKKMLGQNKSTEKTARGSRISYRTWGIACSSVAVVLLGAIAYRYRFL